MGYNAIVTVGEERVERLKRRPIIVHCGACGHEWAPGFAPLPLPQAVNLLTDRECPQCQGKMHYMGWRPKALGPGADVWDWVFGGDTGLSSLSIWAVMQERQPPDVCMDDDDGMVAGQPPGDASDAGRCVRLLRLAPPEWRAQLSRVSDAHPKWKPYVDRWAEIERAYADDETLFLLHDDATKPPPAPVSPKLAALMREIAQGAA